MGYKCYYFSSNDPEFNQMNRCLDKRFNKNGETYIVEDDMRIAKWYPCFSNVVFDGLAGLNVAFNISYDYNTAYIDSPAFAERVNYWINEGKSMGLDFEGLEWRLYQNVVDEYCVLEGKASKEVPARALMFYLPMGKYSSRKELLMHLFFLRLLYEKHATIDYYIELRKKLAKSHPFISRLGTLIIAEAQCHRIVNPIGTKMFAYGAHPFLTNKSLKCVVLCANQVGPDNLREWFKKAEISSGGEISFDKHLIGPQKKLSWIPDVNGAFEDAIDSEMAKGNFQGALALITKEYIKELNDGSKD